MLWTEGALVCARLSLSYVDCEERSRILNIHFFPSSLAMCHYVSMFKIVLVMQMGKFDYV